MESEFIGRQSELTLFDDLWNSSRAALVILYGRRRVGKTRLMTHWLRDRGNRGLYWMAEATSALDQLRSFSQALHDFENPDLPAPLDLTFPNWEYALRKVALLGKDERMVLFMDEFTYLLDVNPTFVGVFQKVWDHYLSKSNVMIVLSGSQMGMMQKHLLSYDAPLYGRSSAQIKLAPLTFGVTSRYFPDYEASERIKIYAIWGGIPAYWERLDQNLTVMENVQRQLQPSNSWMLDEPRLLLQDFITDPHNYVGILRAIARGDWTFSEISERTGLSSGHTSRYLSIIRDTGFVERVLPVSDTNPDSRRGRYVVADPYLRFYYRFLAAHQTKLAIGQQEVTLEEIESGLAEFIGHNTWPELCRRWLLLASAKKEIPLPIEDVGGEWKRSFAIDVVGMNEIERCLVMGVCHWGDEPAGPEPLLELVEKVSNILPRNTEDWQVYFLGFASAGWQEAVTRDPMKLINENRAGRNRSRWQEVGVKLLDLNQVDADLDRWSL